MLTYWGRALDRSLQKTEKRRIAEGGGKAGGGVIRCSCHSSMATLAGIGKAGGVHEPWRRSREKGYR